MADDVTFWLALGACILAMIAVGQTILLLTQLITINENIKKLIARTFEKSLCKDNNEKPQPEDCGIDDIRDDLF